MTYIEDFKTIVTIKIVQSNFVFIAERHPYMQVNPTIVASLILEMYDVVDPKRVHSLNRRINYRC